MKEGKGVIMNFFPYLNLGFALLNHEIKRVTVVSSLDCAMECTATRECRSFSFNSNESVQGNCQLNDATQSICSPSECKKSDGHVHYEASQLVSKYYQFLCKKEMSNITRNSTGKLENLSQLHIPIVNFLQAAEIKLPFPK